MALYQAIKLKLSDALTQLAQISGKLSGINQYRTALNALQTQYAEAESLSDKDLIDYAEQISEKLSALINYLDANQIDIESIRLALENTDQSLTCQETQDIDKAEQFNAFLTLNSHLFLSINTIIATLKRNIERIEKLNEVTTPESSTGPLTPRQFGAAGDGETDDTDALQNAINYCAVSGEILYLDGLAYLVSRPLICETEEEYKASGLKISGENASILIAENFERGEGKAVFDSLVYQEGELSENSHTRRRMEFSNIQILNPYEKVVAGIAASGMTGCSQIEDIRVDHCYHGVMFSGGWVMTIRRVYASYCTKIGLFLGAYKHLEYDYENDTISYGEKDYDLEIVNEGFYDSRGGYNAANAIIIEGCRCQRNQVGIAFHGGTNVQITENNCELNYHAEFQATYSVASCLIENNYFENTSGSQSFAAVGAQDCALKNGTFKNNWLLNVKMLLIGMDSSEITHNTLEGAHPDVFIGPWVRKNVSQWPARYDSTPITPTPEFIRDGEIDESLTLRHGGTFSSGLADCILLSPIQINDSGLTQTLHVTGGMHHYVLPETSISGKTILIDGVKKGSATIDGICGEEDFVDVLAFCGNAVAVTAQLGDCSRWYRFADGALSLETGEDCVVSASFIAKPHESDS